VKYQIFPSSAGYYARKVRGVGIGQQVADIGVVVWTQRYGTLSGAKTACRMRETRHGWKPEWHLVSTQGGTPATAWWEAEVSK
jgi:hypothetical protein